MDLISAGLNMRSSRWKALLFVVALCSITVMGIEAVYAVSALQRGVAGRLGIERGLVMHQGREAYLVRGFRPGSRAAEAGLRVGDLVVPERWYDMSRSHDVGESVAVRVVRGEQTLNMRLPTTARPIDVKTKLQFAFTALLCSLGTVIGLVIGLRQAERKTSRALALAFLCWSMNLGSAYAAPHWPQAIVGVANTAMLLPGWYLGLWFAVHYPDETPRRGRRLLQRLLPLFLLSGIAGVALSVGWALAYVSTAVALTSLTLYVGVSGLCMLLAFGEGWWHSTGPTRQRFAWLLGSFALFYVASFPTYLSSLFDVDFHDWVNLFSVLGTLTMYLGLSYAILRHRVLDIGLALNRSLVFAVVGTSLLGSFHFLQVLASRLLHFDDPAKAGLLSGVLAVLVVLAYPKIKPWAERLIDRLFFSTWLAREADLQRFALDAKGFTQTQALATALVAALDRFTTGAGAALYTRRGDNGFERQATSLSGAPATLAADEPLAVALRAGRAVARGDEAHSQLSAELAVTLARQRDVEAWVLIGHQRDGRALRADEVAALRDALHSVGVEWQALRWGELQRALAAGGASLAAR